MKSVEDAINFIHSRPKGGQKESFARMYALLSALGNPQNQLPPAIHVTGTNGKGSVSTMASFILKAAGYRTGLFISPFIVDFRERIQIDNQLISAEDLLAVTRQAANALEVVDQQLAPDIPTEFEVLTAIMFTYFSHQQLDAIVIEVGIGGLLDSTNVMPNSRVAIITSIGLDHQNLLGNTIVSIAKQKAGIIHDNMAVVIGDLPKQARQVIAEQTNSSLIQGELNTFKQGLPGNYQIQNTATAVAGVRAFDANITDEQIQQGLDNAKLPARFEMLKPGVLIDGAHNAQGLKKLFETLNVPPYQKQPVTLIIGSLMDKNVTDEFKHILSDQRFNIVLVPFAGPNGRHSLDILKTAANYRVSTAENWREAYQESNADLTVFTGSLYFVSEIRGELL
ncbi:bifunctional folylpolyglutamate synthase/dihydrofolate synthase [Leuconostoc carnosum]|uniref:bifunctional folylpolyglutamate synthase/dihydrofolate synthase n=1 Tax=Leuconostoc carnosum TaxID=1252 RepID=UPI00123B7477|nr:folylpolyglutamate synthase/dihydrofolate synthase family protein [Leuconostoc carnosum]KAA8369689.1 bifunctional folylpolyglutamate synthase/dihydrofolate synthase [Leuconostoc carnosum]